MTKGLLKCERKKRNIIPITQTCRMRPLSNIRYIKCRQTKPLISKSLSVFFARAWSSIKKSVNFSYHRVRRNFSIFFIKAFTRRPLHRSTSYVLSVQFRSIDQTQRIPDRLSHCYRPVRPEASWTARTRAFRTLN